MKTLIHIIDFRQLFFMVPFVFCSLLGCKETMPVEFYIAVEGSENAKGNLEDPFASIDQAVVAVREMRKKGTIRPVTIYFREGEYPITESITLNSEDGGTPDAPVTYAAYPGEKVVLSGAVEIPNDAVKPVSDDDFLSRIIDKKAATRLLQVDLAALGITEYGENQTRGWGVKDTDRAGRPLDFIINGERLIVARWPNPGEIVEIGEIIDAGVDHNGRSGRGESDASSGKFVKEEARGGTFTYPFSRPTLWKSDQAFLSGVLSETWVWSYVGADIDKDKQQLKLKTPIPYGLINNPGKNFFHFEDIPEEMDIPGEYWLDRQKGILYFLPPDNYGPHSGIRVSMLNEPMFKIENTSSIKFSNIIFEGSRDVCLEITNSADVDIEHCEIRNFLKSAIIIENGKSHNIESCHIHDIGSDVLLVDGGEWETLSPSGIEINNNHIHSFGYYIPSGNSAISLSGVGTKVTHNRIHDAPHTLINFKGNNHVIMYNDFYDAVRDFFDAGAINCHLGNDPTQRGTVISSNYFHEIGMKMNGCKAVYTDGASFEVTIEKNIFQNIGTGEIQNNAINNNTGSYINIRNNIFLNVTMPLKNYYYLSQANSLRYNMYKDNWKKIFGEYDFTKMPHGEQYPALLRFWDEEHELPTTNSFVNNIIYNTDVTLLNGEYVMTARNKGIPIEELMEISGNVVFTEDPGFVDFQGGDLMLKEDADAFKEIPAFEEVPFNKMGLVGPTGPRGISQSRPQN